MKGILITSVEGKESQVKGIVQEIKDRNSEVQIFTCSMCPEYVSGIVGSDGCFKVPICTSEDYVETMFSLCLGYNISHIITITDREFIILSANKDLFTKYGVQVIHQGHIDDTSTVLGKKMNYAGGTIAYIIYAVRY